MPKEISLSTGLRVKDLTFLHLQREAKAILYWLFCTIKEMQIRLGNQADSLFICINLLSKSGSASVHGWH